jgi:hypothetical protein
MEVMLRQAFRASVALGVRPGNAPDTATVNETAINAAASVEKAGGENEVQAIVAGNGYHSTKVVTAAAQLGMRAYIPERGSPRRRRWTDKDPVEKRTVYATRKRTQSRRGKQISWMRSELTDRSFKHVCGTGGASESRCEDSRASRSGI